MSLYFTFNAGVSEDTFSEGRRIATGPLDGPIGLLGHSGDGVYLLKEVIRSQGVLLIFPMPDI